MKKNYRTLILSVFFAASIFCNAQAPDAFQYQAVVSDVKDANVNVRFSIRENTATGTKVYSETHATKTNAFGMVSLQIGKGTPVTGTFSGISWAKGVYFIETEVDNGSGYVSTGTKQLLSVPYAKYANNAEKIQLVSSGGKKWTLTIDDQGAISTQEVIE